MKEVRDLIAPVALNNSLNYYNNLLTDIYNQENFTNKLYLGIKKEVKNYKEIK